MASIVPSALSNLSFTDVLLNGVADYATRQRPRHHQQLTQITSFRAGIEAAFPDFLICRKQSYSRCTALSNCCADLAAQIKFLD